MDHLEYINILTELGTAIEQREKALLEPVVETNTPRTQAATATLQINHKND